MNRENERKLFEKNYYKSHACNKDFICKVCGTLSSNRIDTVKLISIAMKPIALPPFTLDLNKLDTDEFSTMMPTDRSNTVDSLIT